MLVYVMDNILKLLHPFMPFITEEIWQTIPHEGDSIMISKFPNFISCNSYLNEEKEVQSIMECIRAIRNRRAEMNVPPSKKVTIYIETNSKDIFSKGENFIKRLAYSNDIKISESFDLKDMVTVVTSDAKISMPMDELVDRQEEIKRLSKELSLSQKELDIANSKLENKGFLTRAPQNVIDKVRENAKALNEKIELIKSSIEKLK